MILICSVNVYLVQCSPNLNLENGLVQLSGILAGDMASYKCLAGYEMIGDIARMCQSTGQWSGSSPECKCKLFD